MLARLGFGQTETTMHSQRHHLAHDIGADAIDQPHVHRRGAPDLLIRAGRARAQNRPGVPLPRSTTVVRNSS